MKITFNVEIVCLGSLSSKLLSKLTDDIPINFFDMSSLKNFRQFSFSFVKLIRYLYQVKPQIVHTYLNTANVFGLLAARVAGIHNVITSRRDMGYFRSVRIAFVESFLSRMLAVRVFCVCKSVADVTNMKEKIKLTKLRILLNGIDVNLYNPGINTTDQYCVSFSMIASMNREMKGHMDLIKAVNIVMQRNVDNIKFYMVGDGPLRKKLESEVYRLNLDKCIIFFGEQGDMIPVLKKTDVLIAPSHTEGISNSILESMAMEVPVIATEVDGNKEVVLDKVTGILVPVKNKHALANAILQYANNKALIYEHGHNARRRVAKYFSLETMRDAYMKAYMDIL